jgi:hypothetical protein
MGRGMVGEGKSSKLKAGKLKERHGAGEASCLDLSIELWCFELCRSAAGNNCANLPRPRNERPIKTWALFGRCSRLEKDQTGGSYAERPDLSRRRAAGGVEFDEALTEP